jgi:hypothetical protein
VKDEEYIYRTFSTEMYLFFLFQMLVVRELTHLKWSLTESLAHRLASESEGNTMKDQLLVTQA